MYYRYFILKYRIIWYNMTPKSLVAILRRNFLVVAALILLQMACHTGLHWDGLYTCLM